MKNSKKNKNDQIQFPDGTAMDALDEERLDDMADHDREASAARSEASGSVLSGGSPEEDSATGGDA